MRYVPTLLVVIALFAPTSMSAAQMAVGSGAQPVELVPAAHRDPYGQLFAVQEPRQPLERVSTHKATLSGRLAQSPAPVVAAPIEYSHAYRTRLKIHKLASFAILPLFATELVLGQSIYDSSDGGAKKDAHVAVGIGIGTLFGVNTVTGVWNLWESRKDPNGRKRRVVHSLLMLASDAGFAATAALAPDSEPGTVSDSRGAHRAAAITSIGLGTAGYLMMLLTK